MRRVEADYHYRSAEGLEGSHTKAQGLSVSSQQPASVVGGVELDAFPAGGDTGGGEKAVGFPENTAPDWQVGDIDHPKLGDLAVVPRVGVLPRGQVHPAQVREATAIRKRLRGSFDDRMQILEDIADGECVGKVQVSLSLAAPALECPNCGELGLVPKSGDVQEIEVRGSATPKERLAALDILAKYGLGQLKEVSVENVRERVGRTVALARQLLQPDLAEQFVQAMRPIWKDS